MFNPIAIDRQRASERGPDGREWASRQLRRDRGKRDGDWLCFVCGWRNWRCFMLCKHCWLVYHADFRALDLDIPLMIWMNGMTCPDADTRYRLLDELDRPRRPPEKDMNAAGWKV